MKQEYINKLPQWFNDENGKYDLILSDDLDSLLGCTILQQIKQWNIEYFYTFSAIGRTKKIKEESKKLVAVDIALTKGRCFDNHCTLLSAEDNINEKSININSMNRINRNNYFNKYCGSTALLIWSLYDLPLPKSDIGKMILLAIDSSYLGYYSHYNNDIYANKHYLCDVLDMNELYEIQKKYTKNDFNKVISQFKLKSKINTNRGILSSDLDLENISKELEIKLELPKDTFYLYKQFDNRTLSLSNKKTKEEIHSDIFSFALTGKNYICYSTIKNGDK